MKRRIIEVILILTMVLFGSVNISFAEGDPAEGGSAPDAGSGKKAVRTIMLYACGADLETDAAMASYNLHQVLDANFSKDDNIRFIVMTGGSKQWRINEGKPGEDGKPARLDLLCEPDGTPVSEASTVYNQIWEAKGKDAAEHPGKMVLLDADGISGDGESAKESTDELMSRPEVLSAFIDYCVDNYPAEHYDLILWDHGGGPLQGFGMDEHNGDDEDDEEDTEEDAGAEDDEEDGPEEDEEEEPELMSYGSLIDAISHNKVIDSDGDGKQDLDKNGEPVRFDFIDFDACLMNTVELNLGLADYMDYYIASPETEPGFGQQYTGWLDTLGKEPDKNAYELGKQIVDDFEAFYEAGYEDGSRQEGTLAVVDVKALMSDETGFIAALSELNSILEDEAVAAEFYDELNSVAGSIQYGEMDYFDLGNMVSQLGIVIKEIGENDDDDTNKYSETAQAINRILNNKDIIYAKGTSGIRGKGEWYKDADGELHYGDADIGTQMQTSGMSIFFPAPKANSGKDYYTAVKEALEFLPDPGQDKRADFLLSYMRTMMDYCVILNMGKTVDAQIDSGADKSQISLDYIKKKLDVPFTQDDPSLTEWSDTYVKILDMRDGTADGTIQNEKEVLSWLDGIIKKQVEDSAAKNNISVASVEKKDGTGYKVTISDIHKRSIDNIKVNLVAELPIAEEWIKSNEELNTNTPMRDLLLGDDEGFVIGSVDATSEITLDDIDNYSKWYNSKTGSWNIKPIEHKTYAIKDAEGVLHVGEIDGDNNRTEVIATVTGTKGDGKDELVALIFNDNVLSSIFYVENRKEVAPSQLKKQLEVTPIHYVNFMGFVTYNIKISRSFMVSADNYRDIKLVHTDVSNIPDIADTTGDGQAVHDQFVVNDIYGHQRDFTDIAAASKEKLTDIELARVKPVTYNGEVQIPEVICNGKSLVEDVDYKLRKGSESDVYQDAAEYTVILEGMGKYTGTNFTKFNIVQPEYIAELIVAQAEEEYKAAEEAYLKVLESEESDLAAVKAALLKLNNVKKLLDDAKNDLKKIQDILSDEEVAQLKDKIVQMQEKVTELNDQVKDLKQQINKKANPLNVKGKTTSVKYSKLKKKSQTLALSRVIKTLKAGKGTVTYKKGTVTKKKFTKKFTVNKKTGKITIKKGLKKGTYKIKIKVSAAGDTTYKPAAKTVTVKIKVR